MEQNNLEKFIERYPTYIEAIDIIDNAKIIANKLCDDVYCILQKYHCKESIYEEIGQMIDNFKKSLEVKYKVNNQLYKWRLR